MYRSVRFLAVTLLMIGSAGAQGEQRGPLIGDLFEPDKKQWQDISHQMSQDRYRTAAHNNQRLLRKSAEHIIEKGLTSFGIPKQGIAFTGAVVGLAISGGKLDLNEGKTMALELDEMTNEDRALSFKLKLRW